MRLVVTRAADMYRPHYEKSGAKQGYVCAQVNPSRAAEREAMMSMARRFHAWAPNIAVKLPAVSAGLAPAYSSSKSHRRFLGIKWKIGSRHPEKKAGPRQRPRFTHNLKLRVCRDDVLMHTPAII